VVAAECEQTIRNFSFCAATQLSDRAACVFPCDDVSDCFDRAGQCQTMACVPDAFVGQGGCAVVADVNANGDPCTEECRTCAPGDERRCIPDGTCQNGACAAGDDTYTCSPSPFIICCFGQKNGCGFGNGTTCDEDRDCCSDQCENGLCVG
jgi:hypothetical protein